MTDKEIYHSAIKETLDRIKDKTQSKNKEYSKKGAPFHNFDRAAAARGHTPQQALLGMLMKHLISIIDIIDLEKEVDRTILNEKIDDGIIYLLLLRALYEREFNNKHKHI